MGRDHPLVTVLMTVRNGEPYVREAVKSVLEQNMGDLELLVVDNASDDSSLETVRSFGDDRVRIHLNGRDLGRSPALNVGLRLARGEFVAVLDADDLAEPERLARQVEFLRQNPDVALLGTGYRDIDNEGRILAEHVMPKTHQEILDVLPLYNPIAHSTMVYRRQAALAIGGYPVRFVYAQDFGLSLNMAGKYMLGNLPQVLGAIRRHPGQLTRVDEFETHRLLDSYLLFRQARSVPGVPEKTKAEGRRMCEDFAAQYLNLLDRQGRWFKSMLFRFNHFAGGPDGGIFKN